jgi:hypothetical protein
VIAIKVEGMRCERLSVIQKKARAPVEWAVLQFAVECDSVDVGQNRALAESHQNNIFSGVESPGFKVT